MTRTELSVPYQTGSFLRQRQQTQGICHCRTGFAHPLGNLLLGISMLLHQFLIAHGFFHGIEVTALEVFNECHFHGRLLRPDPGIITGSSVSPAIRDARHRRSPATI